MSGILFGAEIALGVIAVIVLPLIVLSFCSWIGWDKIGVGILCLALGIAGAIVGR